MDDARRQLETLLALEGLHDDLLQQIDALEKRVQTVLAECQPGSKNNADPTDLPEEDRSARAA